jgi:hypothetical protein
MVTTTRRLTMIKFTALFMLIAAPVCALELYLVEDVTEYNYAVEQGERPICQQHVAASRLTTTERYISGAPEVNPERLYIRNEYCNPDPRRTIKQTRAYGNTELKDYAVEYWEVVQASRAGKPDIYTLYPVTVRHAAYIDVYGAETGGIAIIQGVAYSVPVEGYRRVPITLDNHTIDKSGYRRLGEYIAITESRPTTVPLYRQGYSERVIYAPVNLKYSDPVPVYRKEIRYQKQTVQITITG